MFAFGLFAMSSTLFEFVALIGNRFGPSGALARSLKRAFPWAQSDKSGPGSQKLPLEGWGPLNKGCGRRTWALPDVSGGENALLSVFGVGGNAHEECYKDLIEAEKNATEEQIKKVLFLLQSAKDSNNSAVFGKYARSSTKLRVNSSSYCIPRNRQAKLGKAIREIQKAPEQTPFLIARSNMSTHACIC
jgi:hypothetical protein